MCTFDFNVLKYAACLIFSKGLIVFNKSVFVLSTLNALKCVACLFFSKDFNLEEGSSHFVF